MSTTYKQIFFNKETGYLSINKNIKIKDKIMLPFIKLKIKILGNFFKLKYTSVKPVAKLNLCLAHKVYVFKTKINYKNSIFKRIKKNKLIALISITPILREKQLLFVNKISKLLKIRKINSYTKKGIKINNNKFKHKSGKKTTFS